MLPDGQLLARLRISEDHLVERKTASDHKGWLKTVVAFANSTPPDASSVLFIGVTDSGQIETPQANLETLQETLNRQLRNAYPPVTCYKQIFSGNGREALAVIVPFSPNRPHFAGPAYIRSGSKSIQASEQVFNELIFSRNDKVRTLLAYKGKLVSVVNVQKTVMGHQTSNWGAGTKIAACNQHFLTISHGTEPHNQKSFPLDQIEISFDHQLNLLMVQVPASY
jgi:hypothetical protein